MMRSLACLTALAAVAAAASPAAAGAGDEVRLTAPVSYADLDLSQAADARLLANRLRRAAAELCETADITVARQTQARACRQAALRRAVHELQAPLVAAALHPALG